MIYLGFFKANSDVCVPAFYFISAFLFSFAIDKSEGNVKWAVIKVRSLGLLVPYLLWVIFDIFFELLKVKYYQPLIMFFLSCFKWWLSVYSCTNYFFWFIKNFYHFYTSELAQLLAFSGFLQLFFAFLKYTSFRYSNIAVINLMFSSQFEPSILSDLFYYVLGIIVSIDLQR